MAERRRRRQHHSSQEILSEGESQQLSLSQSGDDADQEYVDMSEYESVDDDYEESDNDNEENSEKEVEGDDDNVSKNEEPKEDKKENDVQVNKEDSDEKEQTPSENSTDSTRESGDGKSDNDVEHKAQNRVLKISTDEDSPYFIPTKGNFFQHDTRSDNQRGRPQNNRNFRPNFDKSKWVHDKYDEEEQTPKSNEELKREYGYDIRSYPYGKGPDTTSRRGYNNEQRRPRPRRGYPRFGYDSPRHNNREERRPNTARDRSNTEPPQRFQSNRRNTRPIRSQNFHSSRRQYQQSDRRADQSKFKEDRRSDREETPPIEDRQDIGNKTPDKFTSPSTSQRERSTDTPNSMDNILDVINTREQEKVHRAYSKERNSSQHRRQEKYSSTLPERMKNLSVSGGQRESGQPRRYSSLRQHQRASEPSQPSHHFSSKRSSSQWTNPTPRHQEASEFSSPTTHKPLNEEQTTVDSNSVTNPSDISSNPASGNLFSDLPTNFGLISSEASLGSERLLPSPVPPLLSMLKTDEAGGDNPALIQMRWYEALAYQHSLLNQQGNPMNQSNLLSHPSSLPTLDQVAGAGIVLNDEHKVASSHQLPPISQAANQTDLGTLGSLVFPPPPLPHNFPPSNFVQRNVMPERPVMPPTLPPQFNTSAPGLMGQQVGGVTYYTNPVQNPMQQVPPNVVPVNTPVGSPMRRLNAAIPIKQPME